MAWVYLDDQFPDHPKIVLAGGDAGWLWVCGLAYVRRFATEGLIPKGQIPKLSDRRNSTKLARRLVEVGLWEDRGEHYAFHDYGDWNKPQKSRTEAARKAARARWGTPKGNADAHADAMRDASESMRQTDASECPPPSPPVTTSTDSSRRLAVPPDDDDPGSGFDRRVVLACGVLAARDLAARQAQSHLERVADTGAWLREATTRRSETLGIRLHELAEVDPDASPEQLADAGDPVPADLEPEPPPEPPPGPRPWASEEETLARVTELHEVELPPPDVPATVAEQYKHLPRRRQGTA